MVGPEEKTLARCVRPGPGFGKKNEKKKFGGHEARVAQSNSEIMSSWEIVRGNREQKRSQDHL